MLVVCILTASLFSQNRAQTPQDAVDVARQKPNVAITRPEQTKTPHDLSPMFNVAASEPSSAALKTQPKNGKNPGFDFYRDPWVRTIPS